MRGLVSVLEDRIIAIGDITMGGITAPIVVMEDTHTIVITMDGMAHDIAMVVTTVIRIITITAAMEASTSIGVDKV